jgi:hypothetical protein
MRYPGEVWVLPPEQRAEGDIKWRRHVLLVPCEDEGGNGTLAYASTSNTEGAFGGASLLIDPATSPRCGFSAGTYVIPCRLVSIASEDMDYRTGRLSREMEPLRRVLHGALGIGRGPGRLRGCIAELGAELAEEAGFDMGVIITEPDYSLARRYQLILPLLDATEYEAKPSDIVVSGKPWLADLGVGIFAVELVQSAFHPIEVVRTLTRVDDTTLARIDQALVRMFGL